MRARYHSYISSGKENVEDKILAIIGNVAGGFTKRKGHPTPPAQKGRLVWPKTGTRVCFGRGINMLEMKKKKWGEPSMTKEICRCAEG